MTQKTPTAAVLVIGNEILSGRTQDSNSHTIAVKMTSLGIRLAEVRVVPDVEGMIVGALNALRARYDYVFTTGGIGPTHDDITAQSVAVAFGRPLIVNEQARAHLLAHYGAENLTPARLLMARTPEGAVLIENPATAAPGFQVENVYVMAGVPSIMKAMLDGVVGRLVRGPQILSVTITCHTLESLLAEDLAAIALGFPDLEIGSYPSFRPTGIGVALVVRGTDRGLVDAAVTSLVAMVQAKGDETVKVAEI